MGADVGKDIWALTVSAPALRDAAACCSARRRAGWAVVESATAKKRIKKRDMRFMLLTVYYFTMTSIEPGKVRESPSGPTALIWLI